MARVTMVEIVKIMNGLIEELEEKYNAELAEKNQKIAELEAKLALNNGCFGTIPSVPCQNHSSCTTSATSNAVDMFEQAKFHSDLCAIPNEKSTDSGFRPENISDVVGAD